MGMGIGTCIVSNVPVGIGRKGGGGVRRVSTGEAAVGVKKDISVPHRWGKWHIVSDTVEMRG